MVLRMFALQKWDACFRINTFYCCAFKKLNKPCVVCGSFLICDAVLARCLFKLTLKYDLSVNKINALFFFIRNRLYTLRMESNACSHTRAKSFVALQRTLKPFDINGKRWREKTVINNNNIIKDVIIIYIKEIRFRIEYFIFILDLVYVKNDILFRLRY